MDAHIYTPDSVLKRCNKICSSGFFFLILFNFSFIRLQVLVQPEYLMIQCCVFTGYYGPNFFHFPHVNPMNFCRNGLSQILLRHFKVMKRVHMQQCDFSHAASLFLSSILSCCIVFSVVQLITSLLMLVLFCNMRCCLEI